MTNNNNDSDLTLGRYQLRFVNPQTERHYRHWRVVESRPVMRLVCVISIFGWMFVSTAVFWLEVMGAPSSESQTQQLMWIAYGIAIPVFVVGLFLSYTKHYGFEDRLEGLGLATLGCAMQWLTLETYPSAIASLAGAMSFAWFATIMRLTPLLTVLSIAPFMGIAAFATSRMYAGEEIDPNDTFWSYGFLATTLFFVCTISIVSERFLRRAYSNERIIEQQQTSLEKSQRLIRRYVPTAVADHIADGRGDHIEVPQRQRVTVLFCDIAGFTDMADRVEPEVMTEVLNEYMSSMANLIEQHGGTLNEFAGDGFMALFGAPDAMLPEDQVRSAVAAASEMQAKMPQLNEQWRKLGLGSELKVRIGINTGMVSVGSYGSQGRMTYTAIGLQTNIAARIESKAAAGETLISDASYQLIHDEIDCEPKGEVECKGVHFPVKVYAPNQHEGTT